MRVYIVTHPEAGIIGVFASEGDWEHYLKAEGLEVDQNDYEGEWVEVYRRQK